MEVDRLRTRWTVDGGRSSGVVEPSRFPRASEASNHGLQGNGQGQPGGPHEHDRPWTVEGGW